MGGYCSKIEGARKPDSLINNVNICTEYISIDKFSPDAAQNNTIIVSGTNNNATDSGNPVASGYIVPGDLCLPFLPGKEIDEKVENYCNNIGDKDSNGNPEWGAYKSNDGRLKGAAYAFRGSGGSIPDASLENVNNTCHYNDCDQKTSLDFSSGCCRGCCAIIGTRVLCQRNTYAADPVVCCFLDDSCKSQDNNQDTCFQTPNKRKTCSPYYRNLKSQNCLDAIKPYCSGDKLFAGQNHWMEMWLPDSQVDVNSGRDGNVNEESSDGSQQRYMKQPCLRALARAVYNDSGNVCTWEQFTKLDSFQGVIDSAGKSWADDVLNSIFSKYIKEFGSPIASINQDGYLQSSSFLDFYWNLCNTFPALCQTSLRNFCSKIKVEDLIEKPEAIKWCGCYMNDDQYTEYEKFSINKECTPYCNMKGNIPLVEEDYTTKVCTQTTCIIDDVSIKLANVINPDGFNFNQLCNSCGGSQISKIFTGSGDDIINDNTIGGNIVAIEGGQTTFSQFIPEAQSSTVKFWYTDIPANAALVDGHMVVQLAVARFFPKITQSLNLETGKDNPAVTLNYTSVDQENYKGLGKGKLYYITGIKDLVYVGNFGSNQNYVVIHQYMTNNVDISKIPIQPGKVQDNQQNYNTMSSINSYYSPNYDFIIDSWPVVYNDKVNDELVKGGIKVNLWNCWSHYTIGFKTKLNISNYQKITDNIRQDNIQIIANECSCIIRGSTIDLEDTKIKSLNITQHCGGSQCFNDNGDTIACGSNSITSQVISDVKNSINDFEQELLKDKRALITGILFIILIVLFFIWISVQHRK